MNLRLLIAKSSLFVHMFIQVLLKYLLCVDKRKQGHLFSWEDQVHRMLMMLLWIDYVEPSCVRGKVNNIVIWVQVSVVWNVVYAKMLITALLSFPFGKHFVMYFQHVVNGQWNSKNVYS